MNMSAQEKAALRALSPEKVALWLRQRGFAPRARFGEYAAVYGRDIRGETQELIVPTTRNVRDFDRRMYQIIDELAGFEDRSAHEILVELSSPPRPRAKLLPLTRIFVYQTAAVVLLLTSAGGLEAANLQIQRDSQRTQQSVYDALARAYEQEATGTVGIGPDGMKLLRALEDQKQQALRENQLAWLQIVRATITNAALPLLIGWFGYLLGRRQLDAAGRSRNDTFHKLA